MAKRWVAGIASLVIIAGSLAVAVHRGSANFGVDFTGGQQLTLDFVQNQALVEGRNALMDIVRRNS